MTNAKETGAMKKLEDYITNIKDYPQKGIIFRDISTVLQDKDGLKLAVDELCRIVQKFEFDTVAGLESRGFLFGAPLAYKLGKGFVMIRKKGKLPRETISAEYELEYGKAEIEIHKDAVKKGERVLLIDDLIATGGTAEAAAGLIERLGANIAGMAFLAELEALKGRERLSKYNIETVLKF